MKISSTFLVSAGILMCVAPGCSGQATGAADSAANDAGSAGEQAVGAIAGGSPHGGSEGSGLAGGGNHAGHGGSSSAGETGTGGGFAGAGADAGSGGAPPSRTPPGVGGDNEPQSDAGAGGVANDNCSDDSGNGCIIEYGSNISALAADDSSVYWVEHGTSDALGNYQNDGRLFKRGFGAATRQQLATDLSGPVSVSLTSTHAFVYLDQAWDANGPNALARIPIAGGSAEIVQRGAQPSNGRGDACSDCLVQSGSTAYFAAADGIYALGSSSSTPVELTALQALSLTVAGQYLYFEGGAGFSDQIWRILLSGGTPERVASVGRSAIRASGGYLYGLEPGSTSYLSRMPLEGSMWTRLPNAHVGIAGELNLVGALFFYDIEQYGAPYRIYQGSLVDPAQAAQVLVVPRKQNVKAWLGTAAALFWTDGHSIRRRYNAL